MKRPSISLLYDEDPLYAERQSLSEADAVLEPVRATLAREREEVLALGGWGGSGDRDLPVKRPRQHQG